MRAAENIRLAIRPVAPTCRDQDRVSLRRWRGIERFFYMGLADLFFLGFNDSKYRSRPQNQFIDRHFIEPGGFAKSFEHGRQRQARTRIAANNHALFLMVLRPKKELYRSWQHIVRHPMMIEWHRQFDKFHKPPRKVSRAFCRCSRGLSWLSRISTERIPQCASGRNLSLPGETSVISPRNRAAVGTSLLWVWSPCRLPYGTACACLSSTRGLCRSSPLLDYRRDHPATWRKNPADTARAG